MKGDYEDFHALKAAENKANSKPIFRIPRLKDRKGEKWIPAFAGMTNNKYLCLSAFICGLCLFFGAYSCEFMP